MLLFCLSIFIFCIFLGSPVIVPDCAIATRVVQRGDNVTLFCDVTGSPAPMIEWLKDMEPLHLSLVNVVYTLQLSNKTLLIFNIDQVGPSLFTCLAANEFGNITYSLILDVQGIIMTTVVSSTRNAFREILVS